jgi:hypothetical protein
VIEENRRGTDRRVLEVSGRVCNDEDVFRDFETEIASFNGGVNYPKRDRLLMVEDEICGMYL